jgi:hypothetical protein
MINPTHPEIRKFEQTDTLDKELIEELIADFQALSDRVGWKRQEIQDLSNGVHHKLHLLRNRG